MTFADIMTRLAALPAAELEQEWHWRDGGPNFNVREALYRGLEIESAAAAALQPSSESGRTIGLAQRACGDLCGLLVGQSMETLDTIPGAGEWSIRAAMEHLIDSEQNYLATILYALDRREDEPELLAYDRRPTLDPAEVAGDSLSVVARLLRARAETDAAIPADLSETALTRPSVWAQHRVDIRFRLHRLSVHFIEHTIQCDKILLALGAAPSEARRIVRATWATRGWHERFSEPSSLVALDAAHAERLASLPTAG